MLISVNHNFFYDEELCKQCGGSCCKRLPGCAIPEDIHKLYPAKTIEKSIEEALRLHEFSIDWWIDEPVIHYLRPAINYPKTYAGRLGKEVPNIFSDLVRTGKDLIFDPAFHGECVFLTAEGCSLPRDKRPDECKKLCPGTTIINNELKYQCNVNIKGRPKLYYAKIWQRSGINLKSIGDNLLKKS